MRRRGEFAGLALLVLTCGARVRAEEETACICGDGRSLEAGVVSYSRNSGRESVVRIEADVNSPRRPCRAIWIGRTEIHTIGTPYKLHLQRMTLKERRFDGCDYPAGRFVKRDKTYEFVFDANSSSIREMRPIARLNGDSSDSGNSSNTNLWDSITIEGRAEPSKSRGSAPPVDPTRELNRTSWVLARKDIKAHYVGVIRDSGLNQQLVALKKIREIKAGQLGQVEAVNGGHAIVRFYEGSRIESFSGNAFRRWFDKIGGPYEEVKDDLYTAFRAEILEVFLEDIIEVNDYLDQQRSDRT